MKYSNRIISEFESILMEMSKKKSVDYNEAFLAAHEYASKFSEKKKLSADEKKEIIEICEELIQDWFPDTSDYSITF